MPVEDPILIFALAMIVFLVAPIVLERYKLPGIVGIILIGAAIGPNGLGILDRDATIILLGEVGLVYLMFIAGLEINLNQFIAYRNRSIVFGVVSFAIPQAVGTVLAMAILDLTLAGALLFGAIFSSHTLLAYPIVNRLGITRNEAVTVAIGGTILTDTLALLVLAVGVAAVGGVLDGLFWVQLGVGLTAFFIGIWLLVPRVARWFFRAIDQESYFDFVFVMAVLFVCAYLAELVGVKHIIGAFLAGLALNRLIPQTGPLMNRIEFVGNALFIPFFLLSVGMLVNVWVVFDGIETLLIAGLGIGIVLVTKFMAAWFTGRLYQYTWNEMLGMYGLSIGQAAAALAIVLIGFQENIPGFTGVMINGVVLMILVISVVSPAVVERAGQGIRRKTMVTGYDPTTDPQRMLVPFSRSSHYWEHLMEFALLLRGSHSTDPIYALSVVQPGAEADAEVAAVEETLADTEIFAAGAEVPVQSRIQIDHNPASGIVRAVTENRINTIVIGWDGARSRRQNVFGSVIDQVIRQTDRLILVTRAREPLQTIRRLVVVFPPEIEHNAGFTEVAHHIKRLADGSEGVVHGIVVNGDPHVVEVRFGAVKPAVPTTFESVEDWDDIPAALESEQRTDDLVIAISARRGTMGWDEALRTIPGRIATTVDTNFVVIYPSTHITPDDRRFLRF